MLLPNLALAALLALPGQSSQPGGAVGGVVVNASDGETPAGRTEVVLRMQVGKEVIFLDETTTDERGRYLFQNLRLGTNLTYLPGASRQGVHYPGPRIQLTAERPDAFARLKVHDAVEQPNPLVVLRHEIEIRPQPGALSVTESMLVDNPTQSTYIGRPAHDGGEPVTMQLSIPPDFERTTFHEEFFGRRFALIDRKLVTGIPWTPGQRELKFTYLLPNAQKHRIWERPLDLPCSQVRVRIRTDDADAVSCTLPQKSVQRLDEAYEVVFESNGETLPAAEVIRLELGSLPVPWMTSARWVAVVALVLLIAGVSFVMLRRRSVARRTREAERPAGHRDPAIPEKQRKSSTRRAA
ncbi:MAG TPA: hypothetical protein VMY42_20215 [Thermoguttaceae bacterium]|nr:hypothetical protein [Thermoguttaceae bacterium]